MATLCASYKTLCINCLNCFYRLLLSMMRTYVIVRHLIQVSLRYKCWSRRWQNDIIETELQLRFLLHHSDTSYKGIYKLRTHGIRCFTVLENDPLCSLSPTNLARDCLLGWAAHYRMEMALVNQPASSVSCLNFSHHISKQLVKDTAKPRN